MDHTPLMELEESWVFGMLWPKRLRIFEDRIEISSTELLRETVETVEYREIEDVLVGGSGPSSSILIRKHMGKPILMRGVDRESSHQVKTLVEERKSRWCRKFQEERNAEALVRKLAELLYAGVLSPEEFEAKRRAVEGEEP
ncbi:hypothetical protein BH23ACT11_BH23ACT11_00020 [soil metagenome]